MAERRPSGQTYDRLVIADIIACYNKLTEARKIGKKWKYLSTALLIMVFLVYGLLIRNVILGFNQDLFFNEILKRAMELKPEAEQITANTIRKNKPMVLAKIKLTVKKHTPEFEKRAEEQIPLLVNDLQENFLKRLDRFAKNQIHKQQSLIVRNFPEFNHPEYITSSEAALSAGINSAVRELLTDDFKNLQNDIDNIKAEFSTPAARKEIEKIKADPDSQKKLLQSFFYLIGTNLNAIQED